MQNAVSNATIVASKCFNLKMLFIYRLANGQKSISWNLNGDNKFLSHIWLMCVCSTQKPIALTHWAICIYGMRIAICCLKWCWTWTCSKQQHLIVVDWMVDIAVIGINVMEHCLHWCDARYRWLVLEYVLMWMMQTIRSRFC